MIRQRNNPSSTPLLLLLQHVSVIRPSSSGIQKYTVLSSLLDCNSCYHGNHNGLVSYEQASPLSSVLIARKARY
jgi:hypothetical protein